MSADAPTPGRTPLDLRALDALDELRILHIRSTGESRDICARTEGVLVDLLEEHRQRESAQVIELRSASIVAAVCLLAAAVAIHAVVNVFNLLALYLP